MGRHGNDGNGDGDFRGDALRQLFSDIGVHGMNTLGPSTRNRLDMEDYMRNQRNSDILKYKQQPIAPWQMKIMQDSFPALSRNPNAVQSTASDPYDDLNKQHNNDLMVAKVQSANLDNFDKARRFKAWAPEDSYTGMSTYGMSPNDVLSMQQREADLAATYGAMFPGRGGAVNENQMSDYLKTHYMGDANGANASSPPSQQPSSQPPSNPAVSSAPSSDLSYLKEAQAAGVNDPSKYTIKYGGLPNSSMSVQGDTMTIDPNRAMAQPDAFRQFAYGHELSHLNGNPNEYLADDAGVKNYLSRGLDPNALNKVLSGAIRNPSPATPGHGDPRAEYQYIINQLNSQQGMQQNAPPYRQEALRQALSPPLGGSGYPSVDQAMGGSRNISVNGNMNYNDPANMSKADAYRQQLLGRAQQYHQLDGGGSMEDLRKQKLQTDIDKSNMEIEQKGLGGVGEKGIIPGATISEPKTAQNFATNKRFQKEYFDTADNIDNAVSAISRVEDTFNKSVDMNPESLIQYREQLKQDIALAQKNLSGSGLGKSGGRTKVDLDQLNQILEDPTNITTRMKLTPESMQNYWARLRADALEEKGRAMYNKGGQKSTFQFRLPRPISKNGKTLDSIPVESDQAEETFKELRDAGIM